MKINELNKLYYKIIEPKNLIGNMGFDELMDWLDLGTKQDCINVYKICKIHKMFDKAEQIKSYINNKKWN